MNNIKRFSSRKEVTEFLTTKAIDTSNWSEEKWLSINKGQAEIHMMMLSEKIYDAMNESTPKQLQAGEWHIPFEDKIIKPIFHKEKNPLTEGTVEWIPMPGVDDGALEWINMQKVKISTAMAARTSYTIVGEEKEVDYEALIGLHDRLLAQNPPHSSPLEHCARAMSDDEYCSYVKGTVDAKIDADGFINIEGHTNLNVFGWCNNFKGFITYRHIIETQNK